MKICAMCGKPVFHAPCECGCGAYVKPLTPAARAAAQAALDKVAARLLEEAHPSKQSRAA